MNRLRHGTHQKRQNQIQVLMMEFGRLGTPKYELKNQGTWTLFFINQTFNEINFIYIILFLWHVKTRIITLKSSIFIFQNLCQSAYDWLTAYDSEISFNHSNRKLVWAMQGLSVSQALDNFPYWLWPIRTNQDAIPSIATQSIAISDASFMLNVKHWNIIWQKRRNDFFDHQQKLLARWLAWLSNT